MDALLTKRKTIKGQATRIENNILEPLFRIELLASITDGAVALYTEKVQKQLPELESLHEQISAKCKAEEFETHETEFSDLATKLESLDILLRNANSKILAKTANVLPASRPSADIRLPPIDLPKFGGNYTEWLPFHDLFLATVHNNAALSGSQKLHYLKNFTYADAARLIHSLQLTDGNYAEAWDILNNRFNNTREIVDAHVKNLFSQSSIREESATALRCLIDTTSECIRSLKVLQEPVQHWDAILIHIVKEKLDPESRRQWELSLTGSKRPKYDELATFLEQRARALAAAQSTQGGSRSKEVSHSRKHMSSHHGAIKSKCVICTEDHPIFKCPTMTKASLDERWTWVKKHSLCFNCLRSDHQSNDCKAGACRRCNAKHNTLLHRDSEDPRGSNPTIKSHVTREQSMTPSKISRESQVILPTARIEIMESTGRVKPLRALLDSASQATFITEQSVRQLQLKRNRHNVSIGGIGASGIGTSRGSVRLNIKTGVDTSISVEALILNRITEDLPSRPFNPSHWSHIQGLKLADPTFHIPGSVDILLGGDIYFEVIENGKRKGRGKVPIAFKTSFGWAIGGELSSQHASEWSASINVHSCTLDEQLSKFWELEELPPKKILTLEEQQCEISFESTYSRDLNGRFIVRLPFKVAPAQLGDSRRTAIRRLSSTERRLQADSSLHDQYHKFMNEYLEMKHMILVPPEELGKPAFYLPHHAIIKESSSTTKLRVVFDASAKTTRGVSLNDILLVGPKLQDDLITLLIRFRSYLIVMTADIAKMYRQIWMHSDDTDWQRILWRSDPKSPIQEYRLLTVTYGTSPAPYLATKALQQLSREVEEVYPLASEALAEDFCMDDLMTGASTTSEGVELQAQLIKSTNEAGFELRKWASNDPALLESLPPELRELQGSLRIDSDETIKTLGLYWTPAADHFSYSVTTLEERATVTKRTILSDTAKVFDPFGLLAPVIITSKLLLQEMWQLKLDWDEQLPPHLICKWRLFKDALPEIEKLRIRRYISQSDVQEASLHGFSDASEKAFAAVVYLKTISMTGKFQIQPIAAKTRVAALKKTTLPRLELCGAVLLARLIKLVQGSLKKEISIVHCWTDSTIVLAWVTSSPQRWKTFVANRVADIQETIPTATWHHVPGEDNPADCASRGLQANELQQHALWWHGPPSLRNLTPAEENFPFGEPKECSLEERAVKPLVAHAQIDNSLFQKYSSLRTLINVTGYFLRFIHNARIPKNSKESRRSGPLSANEREMALKHWIKRVQQEVFYEEIERLHQKKDLPSKSKLLPLSPFLDEHGILRVGGRLQHAKISPDQIHPMILPRRSKLTDLIINHEHVKQLHGGSQLLISILQRRFWIIRIRNAVRFHVRRCVRCIREQAATSKQLMGDLPALRVNPARAFLNCGVDYAGPFQLRVLKGRGQKTIKAYIALFACFTTRVLHLEVVSDQSTEAFLAALKRFISRRGKCANIFSDCGTNFVGANREMKNFIQIITSTSNSAEIIQWAAEEGINWQYFFFV